MAFSDLEQQLRRDLEKIVTERAEVVAREMQSAARTPGGLSVGGFKNPSGETAASISIREIRFGAQQWTITYQATSTGAFFTNLGKVLTPNAKQALSWVGRGTGGRVFAKSVDMTRYAGWFAKELAAQWSRAR